MKTLKPSAVVSGLAFSMLTSSGLFAQIERYGDFFSETSSTVSHVPTNLGWLAVNDTVVVSWCDTTEGKKSGSRDTVYVCMEDVSNTSIISYQLEVAFEENMLNAVGAVTIGTISEVLDTLIVNTTMAGRMMVIGYGTTPLIGSGSFVGLVFDVIGNPGDETDICLESLLLNAGDPRTVIPDSCRSYPITAPQCLRNGDVNGDSTITPRDALCAFRAYLLGGRLDPDCDMPDFDCELVAADANCDGAITPRDAQAIFRRYLSGLEPEECFGTTSISR